MHATEVQTAQTWRTSKMLRAAWMQAADTTVDGPGLLSGSVVLHGKKVSLGC